MSLSWSTLKVYTLITGRIRHWLAGSVGLCEVQGIIVIKSLLQFWEAMVNLQVGLHLVQAEQAAHRLPPSEVAWCCAALDGLAVIPVPVKVPLCWICILCVRKTAD